MATKNRKKVHLHYLCLVCLFRATVKNMAVHHGGERHPHVRSNKQQVTQTTTETSANFPLRGWESEHNFVTFNDAWWWYYIRTEQSVGACLALQVEIKKKKKKNNSWFWLSYLTTPIFILISIVHTQILWLLWCFVLTKICLQTMIWSPGEVPKSYALNL